jgi:5-(carboxyamino)imidazole ribonucleotide synthase
MTTSVTVAPGDAIGILGGGQLGRMLALAAASLGLDAHIFTPEEDSPASRVAAKTIVAPFEDGAALAAFARDIKLATIEFENIPVTAIHGLAARGCIVRPGAKSLSTGRDRFVEKSFLAEIGVPPVPFAKIDKAEDIAPALAKLGGRGVMKTRTSGYDGKGQLRIDGATDPAAAWEQIGKRPSILEAWVEYEAELSVIIARSPLGETQAYDIPHNIHEGGVLRRSIFPAPFPAAVQAHARALAETLAAKLDHVGVLALELFLTKDGGLLANEFAPRVHNSGHWTADACQHGQFEQHIRAVCGWPLADPARHSDGEMENLLGEEALAFTQHLEEGASLHLYGKRDAVAGRKMGHVTRLRPKA